ncbi:alpha/beta fold hydrolase [Flexivirga caeni]|uniref:Acyl-CoA thioesterase n=1 Tax=Flexivirga caeni TaxID=2294115 RepID=A0A3M9MC90_9MICO|nr:alpha/beta fold hydrolase [Flexivirga caeni]RNI23182.1 acyl-CoA thioesterase [Flexivirga caeni]
MTRISESDLHWARGGSTGVLVLAGSSGRLDVGRADALAAAGATVLALRWFGGVGQPATPCEVPLETFTDALDLLARECDRLAIVGLSYGAEAALLVALRDPRVASVVALAPTDLVWEGAHLDDDAPPRSKWTWKGAPIPFVPVDRGWVQEARPAFAPYYERSRATADPAVIEAATIPAERYGGDLVLVAGGDDHVWPSVPAAHAIVRRRARHGLETVLVEDANAVHPIVLPGETPPDPTRPYQVGGDEDAPQRLGALAWPEIQKALLLN